MSLIILALRTIIVPLIALLTIVFLCLIFSIALSIREIIMLRLSGTLSIRISRPAFLNFCYIFILYRALYIIVHSVLFIKY